MTEEDEIIKSPKKNTRVQEKEKTAKAPEMHYFAKIASRGKSGKSKIIEITDRINNGQNTQSN